MSAEQLRTSSLTDIEGHIAVRDMAGEMFRLAVEACPNGMVIVDHEGKMVMVNTEVEHQFGYRRDELIGLPVDMLVPARMRRHHIHHRDSFAMKPETRRIGAGVDLFGLRKDGTEFPVEVGLNPISAGENLMVLSVIVDISQRKHMERLKEEFVSTVSHELRTPLTSISGSLGLLVGQWSCNLPAAAARLLTIAHKNSQRLVHLINDILDIEKIESGRVVFNLRRVDLRPLLEQLIEDNCVFAEGFSVHVRLDPSSVDADVNVDPDRFAQIITNLLSNAIKFSPPAGEVLLIVEKISHVVRVSVRDHGAGVPDDFKPHIFEKFAQADATNNRQKGGTGLGLSIVKQIVERLGGTVSLDDACGGGTIVSVDLPAWDGTASGEIDLDAEPGIPRVLFCEDDRGAATAMRQQLRRVGLAVDFAHTVAASVTRASANKYAAILVDLSLPDGDGVSLMLQIRAQTLHHVTPIIVIAADPARGFSDVRSSRLNVRDWLSTPVDFENLAAILKTAVIPQLQIRPRILHVDDDPDVLALVSHALCAMADVVSVETVKGAREALLADRIDLALLDIALGEFSGLDLLPELRDAAGNAYPVIVFSAHSDGLTCDDQIQTILSKSNASLESLVTTIRDSLTELSIRHASEAL